MIEVSSYYDLLPNINMKEYTDWAKNATATMIKAPGVVESRAYRNLAGSPQVQSTYVWKTLADWAKFSESEEWQTILSEIRHKYATNFQLAIWTASPVQPRKRRPKRK